jgi:hypothetical protein
MSNFSSVPRIDEEKSLLFQVFEIRSPSSLKQQISCKSIRIGWEPEKPERLCWPLKDACCRVPQPNTFPMPVHVNSSEAFRCWSIVLTGQTYLVKNCFKEDKISFFTEIRTLDRQVPYLAATLTSSTGYSVYTYFFFQCHHLSLMDFVVSPHGCGRTVTDF